MALPSGIVTKTLTISTAVSNGAIRASLEVLIEPTNKTIVWQPTSVPVASFFRLIRTAPDQDAVVQLPTVDQAGFIDENGQQITDWTYTVTVRYLKDGRKVGQKVTKYYRPLTSDKPVTDFDALPVGEAPLNQGPPGPRGLSAYEIAVKDGFVGTETQWLASLSTGGVKTFFDYEQTTPSDTWEIEHNLGFYPGGVTTVNSAGQAFKAEVYYPTINSVRILMVGAQSGTAYLS